MSISLLTLFSLYYIIYDALLFYRFKLVNRQLLEKVFGVESATLYPDFWPDYDPRFTTMINAADVLKDVSKYTPS
mgnify:FL=1